MSQKQVLLIHLHQIQRRKMLLRCNLIYQFVSTTASAPALSLLINTLHKKHTMDLQSVMQGNTQLHINKLKTVYEQLQL